MMRLRCPECDAEIDADDVNLEQMAAKCRRCHAVFRIDGLVGGRAVKPLDTPMPDGMTLEHTAAGLRITRRWFTWGTLFITAFAVFWNGFLVVTLGSAFVSGFYPIAAFASIHILIGLGLIYWALAGFLNRTTVDVEPIELRVRHGPVPFPGKRLEAGAVRQLYAKEHISRRRNSSSVTYELHAVTDAGRHAKLVSGLTSSEQALFLEQEIERYLRLEDRPIRGELAR
jgi:predicted Zn finger-like uncharacterized protein